MYEDQETKRVFTPAPFVSFQSGRNLKSFLVRSNVYNLDRKIDSAKCNGKRCQIDTFVSFQTKQKYKINHHKLQEQFIMNYFNLI